MSEKLRHVFPTIGIICILLQFAPPHSNWRYANTRRYIAQFAATSLENAEREIELWQRVLDELELDSDVKT